MPNKRIKYIIKEALTKTDETQIGVMVRKEIKAAFGSNLEKKVKGIVEKELKGTKFKKEVVNISKDVLEQLYRELCEDYGYNWSELSETEIAVLQYQDDIPYYDTYNENLFSLIINEYNNVEDFNIKENPNIVFSRLVLEEIDKDNSNIISGFVMYGELESPFSIPHKEIHIQNIVFNIRDNRVVMVD